MKQHVSLNAVVSLFFNEGDAIDEDGHKVEITEVSTFTFTLTELTVHDHHFAFISDQHVAQSAHIFQSTVAHH